MGSEVLVLRSPLPWFSANVNVLQKLWQSCPDRSSVTEDTQNIGPQKLVKMTIFWLRILDTYAAKYTSLNWNLEIMIDHDYFHYIYSVIMMAPTGHLCCPIL